MTRTRTVQQDEWGDTFWHNNHIHRKAKAEQHRHKGEKSFTIRQGIDDYFEKSKLKRSIFDDVQKGIGPEDIDIIEDE